MELALDNQAKNKELHSEIHLSSSWMYSAV